MHHGIIVICAESREVKMWLRYAIFSVLLLLLIIAVAYRTSRVARFYVKFYFFHVMYVFGALYTIFTVGIFHPWSPENFHRVGQALYSITRLFYSIKVEVIAGIEHLPSRKDENCIIVANHQSSLDMFVLLKLAPERTTFLAKKELFYAPLFGISAWLSGVVFVNRGNSKSARKVMDNAVRWIKEQKINLWIFPEGTRSQTGSMLPFKKGAFHVAQQAQLSVVPIVVSDYIPLFNKKTKTFENGTIRVTILPKVSTKGLTTEDVSMLTEKVQQQMLKVFEDDKGLTPRNDAIQTKKTN